MMIGLKQPMSPAWGLAALFVSCVAAPVWAADGEQAGVQVSMLESDAQADMAYAEFDPSMLAGMGRGAVSLSQFS